MLWKPVHKNVWWLASPPSIWHLNTFQLQVLKMFTTQTVLSVKRELKNFNFLVHLIYWINHLIKQETKNKTVVFVIKFLGEIRLQIIVSMWYSDMSSLHTFLLFYEISIFIFLVKYKFFQSFHAKILVITMAPLLLVFVSWNFYEWLITTHGIVFYHFLS